MPLGMLELLRIFVLLAVLHGARASSFCQHVVEPLGYHCAEFTVQTGDGFVLALHRLSKTASLLGNGRASSPAGTPAFAPTPVQGDRSLAAHVEASDDPAPWRNYSSIYNLTMLTSASVHIPSPLPAPEMRGNRSTDLRHNSNAANTSIQEGMLPNPSSAPDALNRTSSNHSSELPADVAAGPAPSASQNPLSSSTYSQRQGTTGSGSPSNYTINPGAGKGCPVLLMHQEFFSGDIWFQFVDVNGSVSGLLPIMLLNDGFDVWIGHHRATYWGHGHARLRSTDREYWDWTWDQHVQYDLPALLLFISTETNQPVHFIGASQAAAVGAAAATDHESAQMIRSLTLIGPTAYRGFTNSVLLEAWAYFFGLTLDSEYYVTGYQNGAFNFTMEFPMTGPFSAQGLSGTAVSLISGPNCCLSDSAPIQFFNGWDGTTSFKNLLHWQQGIRINTFAHYDYGSAARNIQFYGRHNPPAYNVAQIPRRMPVLVIGGGQDYEAPPHGIRLLLSQLQAPATLINLTNYAHYDLGFSINRERDMYLPILLYLEGTKFH